MNTFIGKTGATAVGSYGDGSMVGRGTTPCTLMVLPLHVAHGGKLVVKVVGTQIRLLPARQIHASHRIAEVPTKMKWQRGLTLIELMIVIAIISITLSLTLPLLSASKASARQSTLISNLRQIGLGRSLYENDFGDSMLPTLKNAYYNFRIDTRLFASSCDPNELGFASLKPFAINGDKVRYILPTKVSVLDYEKMFLGRDDVHLNDVKNVENFTTWLILPICAAKYLSPTGAILQGPFFQLKHDSSVKQKSLAYNTKTVVGSFYFTDNTDPSSNQP